MLAKYYSLDECFEQDKIYDRLDELSNDRKLDYEIIDDDLIKIKDKGLSPREKKELVKLFEENDVIEHEDIDEELDEFDDDDDDDDDEEEEY
jgi:hypothetical protein